MPQSIPRPLVRMNQWVIVLSVALSFVLRSPWIMAVPLVCGLCGLLFGWNPVMKMGRLFLSKGMNTYIPEDKQQQQFNQIIAVTFLTLALIAHVLNWTVAMYVFSGMVFLAAGVAILGFCVGCFIRFQWTQYRYRRELVRNKL